MWSGGVGTKSVKETWLGFTSQLRRFLAPLLWVNYSLPEPQCPCVDKESENTQRGIVAIKQDHVCKGPGLTPDTGHQQCTKICVAPHPCQHSEWSSHQFFTRLIGSIKTIILFQRQSMSSWVRPEKWLCRRPIQGPAEVRPASVWWVGL